MPISYGIKSTTVKFGSGDISISVGSIASGELPNCLVFLQKEEAPIGSEHVHTDSDGNQSTPCKMVRLDSDQPRVVFHFTKLESMCVLRDQLNDLIAANVLTLST